MESKTNNEKVKNKDAEFKMLQPGEVCVSHQNDDHILASCPHCGNVEELSIEGCAYSNEDPVDCVKCRKRYYTKMEVTSLVKVEKGSAVEDVRSAPDGS